VSSARRPSVRVDSEPSRTEPVWDYVAEVGYESPTGEIVLRDDLSGTEFPGLSLNGRAGHYRIRVHYN
jgi:hypothetical protein